jgi:glycine/D-amino acid oxidase-like deaminating enzyme/nitrite reductase/ring-hydroxylating ferredoxin subunit
MLFLKKNSMEQTHSLWMDIDSIEFPQLDQNYECDVCIVGAGIAGLTSAYTLAKSGKSVIVLDQAKIAGGQSARTTAHLSWVLENRYLTLAKYFGSAKAKGIAESHAAAIDYIEKIIHEEQIECDFARINGYLFADKETDQLKLDEEYDFLQTFGLEVEKVSEAPFPDFKSGFSLCFPKQGQLHIIKYLNALSQAICRFGGKIFNQTHVNQVEDGQPCLIKTDKGFTIKTQSVIMATCTPVNNRLIIHSKQAAYRTYVFAAAIQKGSFPKALFWDTADPYHYIRTHPHLNDPELDWLIIGGADHKTGQEKNINFHYWQLEEWAKERFTMINKIDYRWSGQVFESMDGIGFIGRNPNEKNIYIATGDTGNGITHGTIAGMLIPDLILGKRNHWETLYQPSRKTLAAASHYLKENLNVACQYADWLTPGEIKKIKALRPDEGAILREGLKKLAIYKDKEGKLHINSAFCPHLGGCVHWNDGEKSWDCPCHGSRFTGHGKVITGPAIDDLKG